MSDIRLYMFQSGYQRCKYHDIRMNQGEDSDYIIPVPWFLLTHPQGNVVIDGGLAVEGLKDPRAYWGPAVEQFQPIMDINQGCRRQLAKLGIRPESVRYVLLSHLHSDHTGAIGRFPEATHLVQRAEYDYAFSPDWFTAGAYCRKDFHREGLKWQFLAGDADDGFDLYGDGVLKIIYTPGHSPGHQSFVVSLPSGKSFTLAIDAAYTLDHFQDKALPGLMPSASQVARSVAKLRVVTQMHNAEIIPGHDPDIWPHYAMKTEGYN